MQVHCISVNATDLLSMTPYLAALARRRRRVIIDRPDHPSSIVARNTKRAEYDHHRSRRSLTASNFHFS